MFFWDKLSNFGSNIALIDGEHSLSYLELSKNIQSFGALLNSAHENDVDYQGKKILLLGIDNSIDSIIAFYAALAEGHVVLVCDNNNQTLRQNLKLNFKPHFEYFNENNQRELFELNDCISSDSIHPDLALMISTSGSTGSGKCVRLSKQNLQENTNSICQYLNIKESDNAALILPIHYCYGLSVLNTHLASGATVHVGELSVASVDFIPYLIKHKISSIAGVPYTYEILERASFRKNNLPYLRYMTQAGGRLSPELVSEYANWAIDNHKQFFVMYGQTEATARMAYLPQDKILQFPGSIGLPIPGGAFFIKGEDNQLTEESNMEGELVYKGKNVMMGYASGSNDLHKNPEHDFLETGDIAYKDKNGLFFIVGRLKRFTKIYGKRFNLDEIERSIATLGVNAICVSDDKNLYACIEGQTTIDIAFHIEQTFGIANQNIEFHEYQQLPLLSSGKVDYRTILAESIHRKSENDKEAIASSLKTLNTKELKSTITQLFQNHLKKQKITENDSFTSLGGDSMTYVGLSIDLERTLGYLPENWQNMSIYDISRLQAIKNKYAHIQTDILLRVYAVLAVVFFHSGVEWLRGGAALLLLLAGYNYARFQLNQQVLKKPLNVLGDFSTKVLIPYWLVLIGYSVFRYGQVSWPDVFLISNNFNSDTTYRAFGIWFIEALFQSIIIFTTPLFFPKIRELIRNHLTTYVFSLLLFASLLRIIDEYTGWGDSLNGGQISWAFWLFTLGATIHTYDSKNIRAKQIFMSLLIILLTIAFYYNDHSRAATVSVGALLILWLNKLAVPRLLVPLFNVIASSSLFIYMLHPRAPVHSYTSDWSFDVIRIATGVILGITVNHLYNFVRNKWTKSRNES